MAFQQQGQQQFDPNQGNQFAPENGGMQQGGGPPQGMQTQQPQQGGMPPQQQQEGGSPAPFAQQGGVEGSGSVSGDAKTTLWYVYNNLFLFLPKHLPPPRVESNVNLSFASKSYRVYGPIAIQDAESDAAMRHQFTSRTFYSFHPTDS